MPERSEDLSSLRETFVDRVIIPFLGEYRLNGQAIEDPLVVEAFRSVDRGLFVLPGTHTFQTYGDYIIPLQEGSTISQPGLVALMMHGLQLNGRGKVLEIGTASGYGAALLSRCAEEVHTIECSSNLADRARELLDNLGYKNIIVYTGDGLVRVPGVGPFDRIIVTAGLRKIPKSLVDQLVEGGVIIAPVGDKHPLVQDVIQGVKHGKKLQQSIFLEKVLFVPVLSAERGGWTQAAYSKSRKMRFEQGMVPEQSAVTKSEMSFEEAERLLSEMISLDPILEKIGERIGVLMEQGLSLFEMENDPELIRLRTKLDECRKANKATI